ncbi:MAG: hypothetical protein MJK04_32150, partial [Psychrosphaera sp.]|nr:hypothetical protein [Psychrosphaera sp.]
MKKLAVIVLSVILLILFRFVDFSNQQTAAAPLASQPQENLKNETKNMQASRLITLVINTLKLPLTAKSDDPAKKPSKTCMPGAEYYASPALATLEHWMLEHIGIGQIANENYLNKTGLTEQAHAGNAFAMLLLGQNYLWHVENESCQAPFLRPQELPQLDNKKRPYDVKTMAKARFWLEQAVLHGMVGGFQDLSNSYIREWGYVSKQKSADEDKTTKLMVTSYAYRQLMVWLLPSFYDNEVLRPKVPPEYQESFAVIVNELKGKWSKDRLAMGFEVQLN